MAHKLIPVVLVSALLCPLSIFAAEGSGKKEPAAESSTAKDAPAPKATTSKEQPPPPAATDDEDKKKPAKKIDLAVEIRRAEKYGGTSEADRERLAALYILNGRISEAYKILRKIIKAAHPDDGQEALGLAVKYLREKIKKLPARGKGKAPSREETVARLRLAMTALALDSPPEALAALEPLKERHRTDKFELRRLAIAALASWSAGVKDDADRDFLELIRKATAGRHLALRSPALVDRVICYGKYDERAAKTVRVGENVTAYVEVLNFHCTRMDTGEHLTALDISLSFEEEVEVKDRRGKPTKVRKVRKDLPRLYEIRHRTRSPLKDLHLVIRFKVPSELRAGGKSYIKITVRDRGNAPPAAKDSEKAQTDAAAPTASVILPLNVYGTTR
jgi:hypothetical protein